MSNIYEHAKNISDAEKSQRACILRLHRIKEVICFPANVR